MHKILDKYARVRVCVCIARAGFRGRKKGVSSSTSGPMNRNPTLSPGVIDIVEGCRYMNPVHKIKIKRSMPHVDEILLTSNIFNLD